MGDARAQRRAKGSHKWRKLLPTIRTGANIPVDIVTRDDLVARVPDIDNDPDEYPTVLLETDPGDIIVFHGLTLHAGRVRFTCYIPPEQVTLDAAGTAP